MDPCSGAAPLGEVNAATSAPYPREDATCALLAVAEDSKRSDEQLTQDLGRQIEDDENMLEDEGLVREEEVEEVTEVGRQPDALEAPSEVDDEEEERQREVTAEGERQRAAATLVVDGEKTALEFNKRQRLRRKSVVIALKKRSIKCLNKMHAMEDAREGSEVPAVQPSSPGHAEHQRAAAPDASADAAAQDDLLEHNENVVDDDDEENEEESSSLGDPTADNRGGGGGKSSPELSIECEETNGLVNNGPKDAASEDAASNDTVLLDDDEMEEDTSGSYRNKRGHESGGGGSVERSATPSVGGSANKRLKTCLSSFEVVVDANYLAHDKILNDYMESAGCTGSLVNTQRQIDQLLGEIRTLNELLKEKEREWNNLIHVKKVKEELLLRVQRRKQVLLLNGTNEQDVGVGHEQMSNKTAPTVSNKRYLLNNSRTQQSLVVNKTTTGQQHELNGTYDPKLQQNRQRMVLDVQSIIADYRQKHPESVPRRGRRIRASFNPVSGTGQVKQQQHNLGVTTSEVSSELGQLLSNSGSAENLKSSGVIIKSNLDSSGHIENFKDVFVHFSKMSSNERIDLLNQATSATAATGKASAYSEVTVHPVPPSLSSSQQQSGSATSSATTNSLLHGILTKSQVARSAAISSVADCNGSKSNFSPTLARLLTAPERAMASVSPQQQQQNAANSSSSSSSSVSISDMLSNSKARNEITITPVGGQYSSSSANGHKIIEKHEEEAEDSADRLVIDESDVLNGGSVDHQRGRGSSGIVADNGSEEVADEVPQCQGCNLKAAQFVCAGCGNQWYCSRECQVVAWDEHSEVCSG